MARTLFVALCFALSGACGLIYENVWVKQVSTIFGNTVTATTVVFGAFMGGLALGAWYLGRIADRVKRPLATYAWLELGITLTALAFPVGLEAVQSLYLRVLVPSGLPRGALTAFELVAVSLLLIVPTALMGATLPVLMRFATPTAGRSGRALGYLYSVNTAGAVVGSLVAGFWLIPTLGLVGTGRVAQVLNLIVGVLALALSAAIGDQASAAQLVNPSSYGRASDPAPPVPPIHQHIFLCGFAAMLYEIALMKLLPLILGSSTYSFSLMLAAFISGIAIGSAVAGAWIGSVRRRLGALGGALIAQGLAFMLSIPLYSKLPDAYVALRVGAHLPFAAYEVVSFGLCFLVMVVPTFFLGAVLPIAAQIVARPGTLADDVGRLYAANTLGNILGTVLTGLVLVPLLGFKATMEVGIATNLISGLCLISAEPSLSKRRRGIAAAVVAVAVLTYLQGYPRLDIIKLNSGVYRMNKYASVVQTDLGERLRSTKLEYAREDEVCFVTVMRTAASLSLRVNGKPDASSAGDMETQKMLAHYPLLLKPDAKSVLVIGLGSGITAGAALTHPIKSLDCAELSPAVIEAAKFFAPWNHDVHADPRLHLIVDDGRNFLERATGQYDVIISEPSNPWIAGIGRLFTVECFRTASSHLTPDGVMAQWMHTYEMDPAMFRTVVRTFRAAFPHVVLMVSAAADVIMLGSNAPLDIDPEALAARMKVPLVKADLDSVRMTGPFVLAAHHLIPEQHVLAEAGEGELNTDDHPVLEYQAPVGFYNGSMVDLSPLAYVDSPHHLLRKSLAAHAPALQEVLDLGLSVAQWYPPRALAELLERAIGDHPTEQGSTLIAAKLRRTAGEPGAALALATRAAARAPGNAHVLESLFDAALVVESESIPFDRLWTAPRSEAAARAWLKLAPGEIGGRAALGLLLFRAQRWVEAEAELTAAIKLALAKDEHKADIGNWMVCATLAHAARGDISGARASWERIRTEADLSKVNEYLLRRIAYRLAEPASGER